MNFAALGDSALLVRVAESLASDTVAEVLGLCRRIEAARLPGVIEVAPAYLSAAVYFDPLAVPAEDRHGWLEAKIAALPPVEESRASRLIEIPVCYDGPDLEEVARRAGLSPAEVIARHSGAEYLVHCLGFTPGFPYLGGLPAELATPRREHPRRKVPAGSVGVGGTQTGIYPFDSPGGWHLIGRTPLELFSLARKEPALLAAGDRVRFRPTAAP